LQEAGVTARVLEDQVGDVHALMVGRHELDGLERAVGHLLDLGGDPERDRRARATGAATGPVGGGRAGLGGAAAAGTAGLLAAPAAGALLGRRGRARRLARRAAGLLGL